MNRYAIVGFGCAGYHAAKAIRTIDRDGEIHVFEATADPPANPMLTTYYASDRLSYEGAFPFGSLAEITDTLRLSLHSETSVKRVHAAQKQLEYENGDRESFDRILIATGARALLPGLKGLPSERVFLMRTMRDAESLKAYLAAHPVKKAVVVGASMVGIKVAELFLNRGVETTIADFAPYLFPLAAFENVAREIERRVSARGVHFLWNAAIEEITATGARFSDGSALEADLVCLCIGTRANVELAANTEVVEGEPVAIKRGIVVNERMETSVSGLYAAGDCCEGTNLQTGETMIIGLWANAGMQGETAGYNMAGHPADYQGNIVHNITHFMQMDFVGLGDNRLGGETITFGDLYGGGSYLQAVVDGGKLRCINLLGADGISGVLKSFFIKQLTTGKTASLPPAQRAILLRGGLTNELIDLIGGEIQ